MGLEMGHEIPDHQMQYDTVKKETDQYGLCDLNIGGNGLEINGYNNK